MMAGWVFWPHQHFASASMIAMGWVRMMRCSLTLSGASWLLVATVTAQYVTMLHFGFALSLFWISVQ
jgi:hypothetical protein